MSDTKGDDAIFCAIINGLAASGELSPEKLQEKGGVDRVRLLAKHASYLAKSFDAIHKKNS